MPDKELWSDQPVWVVISPWGAEAVFTTAKAAANHVGMLRTSFAAYRSLGNELATHRTLIDPSAVR